MLFNKIIMLLVLSVFSASIFADVSVRGYTRQDGTYVEPYHRSEPNNIQSDNWSTKGNVNPYTGQEGTRNPNNYSGQNKW